VITILVGGTGIEPVTFAL